MNLFHRSQANVFLKIIFVFFILAINKHFVSFAYCTELPNEDATQQYVDNLLGSYNSLVKFNDVDKSYFEKYKNYFSLFRDEGYSFQIIFVKAVQNETEYISVIFVPIQSNNPIIVLDFEHAFSYYFPGTIIMECNRCSLKGGLFEYLDTIIYADFILWILSDEITNDTLINSKTFADDIYETDKNRMLEDKLNALMEKYNEFMSSYSILLKDYNNSEIHSKHTDIIENIQYNEVYMLDNLEADLDDLKYMIQNEKEKRESIRNMVSLVIGAVSLVIAIIERDKMKYYLRRFSKWITNKLAI